jgi:hypothetical protein
MIVVLWDPLVNRRLFADGGWSYDGEYVKEIRMAAGKTRTYLLNNHVPKVFEGVGLDLDDERIVASGTRDTERRRFERWLEIDLRHGVLPFQIPRLLRPWENGVYQFVPGSLSFDLSASHVATFDLRELQ